MIDGSYIDVDGDIIEEYGPNVINAGKGNDTVYSGYDDDIIYGESGNNLLIADLSKGADHEISLGDYDYDRDVVELASISYDRDSQITINDFMPKGYYDGDNSDELVIEGEVVDFYNLPATMRLSENEDGDAVLSFGDDDTVTFANVSTAELLGIEVDYTITGTERPQIISTRPI